MDPKKWKKHAEAEGTEYEVANYTLAGRGFYISYNGNDFIRRINAKHGLPNVGDTANPETALVAQPSAPVQWLGDKMRHFSMTYLTKLLKERRKSPWWFKVFSWVRDLMQTEFFILKGDHRDAYEELVPQGLSACMLYFLEKSKTDRHFFSD